MNASGSKITRLQKECIDQVADAFEKEFFNEKKPNIEEFLLRVGQELRPHLLRELLKLEVELRRNLGEQPTADEYQQRFPDDRSIVDSILIPVTMTGVTKDLSADAALRNRLLDDQETPPKIGRYIVERPLGKGGFGVVYLAHDPQLDRHVAIKVPRRARFKTSEHVAHFIQEARTTAKLKHPLLVTIHDVQEEDGLPYIVQEYIEGENLAEWRLKHSPSFEVIVEILLGVAEAIGYAHQQRLTHCDLKLANVLMDMKGQPHVADFGLAIHDSIRFHRKGARFGTPPIMAPEQVRGEGHRLDGRTDIWAIGVMMYQLMVGHNPFNAKDQEELFNEIETLDPRPPRQIDRRVPRELERICLKCLSKRRTGRYNTTDDLKEDLQLWLSTEKAASTSHPSHSIASTKVTIDSDSSPKSMIKILPKGLRSFDSKDADFFLELLPGLRDRDGLPESIRFWKDRIEEMDPDLAFSVGLIYGPSGCGKSSLVKAGLLPRLSDAVIPVYCVATDTDLEVRIVKQLRKVFPDLPAYASMVDTFAELQRTGVPGDRKLLLVIDQFEQWLHSHPVLQKTQLVDALRQCDGSKLQAILLVRDDFFASVHLLFQELENPLLEGWNYALVDRFDKQHSHKVLTVFGRAYGKFDEKLSEGQEQFVHTAIHQLAEDDKVIGVRLALFVDMMKSREWTLASLRAIGGVSGVGVTFLEETFDARTAPPSRRVHEKAIRKVLGALLPGAGSNIKGGMQTESSLRNTAGYENEPNRFAEVVRILDHDLRIITPAEHDSEREAIRNLQSTKNEVSVDVAGYYQLTHDYLVPSLREWLTRKQRETRRGRAELLLEECVGTWNVKREKKQLPTVGEWVNIGLLTRSRTWTETQRSMMQQATLKHIRGWGGILLSALLIGIGLQLWFAHEREKNLLDRTLTVVDALQNNLGPSVPFNLEKLSLLPRRLVLPTLRTRFESERDERSKLALAFGLAQFGQLEAEYLSSQIGEVEEIDRKNLLAAFRVNQSETLKALQVAATRCQDKSQMRCKARLAAIGVLFGDLMLAQEVCEFNDRPDPEQRTLFIDEFPRWESDLKLAREAVSQCENPALRSAICLAVGQIKSNQLPVSERKEWINLVEGWYVEQPDTSTHSAAGWLLTQWGVPPNVVPQEQEISSKRDWFVNGVGGTMLRVRPGTFQVNDSKEPQHALFLSEEIWIADREITAGQFEMFMKDDEVSLSEKPVGWKGVDPHVSPSPDYPAQRVNWYDAILFCNWLSKVENRSPCYEKFSESENGSDDWRLIADATGYRLLHESEWEFMCRAGSATKFSFGDDESMLSHYSQSYPSKRTSLCGQKLPNSWGFYDAHGNVFEWCNDASGGRKMLRGGCYEFGAELNQTAHRDSGSPTMRQSIIGFRIALSQPE